MQVCTRKYTSVYKLVARVLLCVCCGCVILTWWPVRWRTAAFPAGHAGSPRSSSGAGASRRHSCHSSGTCRRRGRLSASEWRTAGPLLHILGSLSRSRWPGVSRGGMKRKWDGGTKDILFRKHNGDRTRTRNEMKREKGDQRWKEMKQQEGKLGWGLLEENRIGSGEESRRVGARQRRKDRLIEGRTHTRR